MVNKAEFVVYPRPSSSDFPGERALGLQVDGVSLRASVADATWDLWRADDDCSDQTDTELAEFVRDLHADLPADDVGWPSRHFLGQVATDYRFVGPIEMGLRFGEDSDTPVLGCDCGIWACSPLYTRITADSSTVRWSRPRQQPRSDWGPLLVGPFTFDRTGYLDSLGNPRLLAQDPMRAWVPPQRA